MKERRVYACVTLYHLYLTLLIINQQGDKENCVILLNANDSHIYEQFCNLEKSLIEAGYKISVRLRDRKRDVWGLEAPITQKQFRWAESKLGGSLSQNFVLYNFAWNMQYVYSTVNLFYKKCRNAYFIEEGALTTINPPQSRLKVLLKRLTGTAVDFYKDDKLNAILVQKTELYPKEWQNKIELLDVKALLDKLTPDAKKTIIKVFLGDFADQIKIENDVGIIYTQPLSEDGFVEESKKIEYFRRMVNYYSKYGKAIVKLHPRDRSDYKFPENVIVLPSFFPSELLNLLNVKFKYAIGICTSAVPTTEAEYKLNINDNFLKDLVFEEKPLF